MGQILTVLNTTVRIQGRNGDPLSTTTLDAFFQPLHADIFTYDPRCLHDPYGSRWIVTAGADPDLPAAGIALAVSSAEDPRQAWFRYFIPADPAGQLYADSPTVGFNRRWIVIQANLYNRVTGEFAESQVIVFDKADLYAGGAGTFTRFRLPGADYGGSQIPATTLDPTLDTLHLVKSWNGNYANPQSQAAEGLLRIFILSGATGSEVLTPGNFVSTAQDGSLPPFVWADFQPDGADLGAQSATQSRIQLGDSRIQSVLYRGGTLWCSQTVLVPAANPTRSGVQWWEIFEDGRLFQRHLIDESNGGWSYAYPSLAVNNHYDVLVGYNGFSPTTHPSAYYRLYPNDGSYNHPLGEQRMRGGLAPYVELYNGQNRWGDWSATCVDPLDDGALWTLQEYSILPTPSDPGRWGVAWAEVVASHDLRLSPFPSTNGVVPGQILSLTLVLSNQSPSFAYDAVVTLPSTAGWELTSATSTNGLAWVSNGVAYCSFDHVGPTPLRCTINGRVTGATPTLSLRATATALGPDSDPSTDTATAEIPLLNAPPLTPPTLAAAAQGTAFSIAWPAGYLGFVVESREAAAGGGGWTPVSVALVNDGTLRRATLPQAGGTRYFRIRWTGGATS